MLWQNNCSIDLDLLNSVHEDNQSQSYIMPRSYIYYVCNILQIEGTYFSCPTRKIPLRADQSVGAKDSIFDFPVDDISANDGRIHGVGVFPPCRLGHGLPRMAVEKNLCVSQVVQLLSFCLATEPPDCF
jgi:hypothetical protein